MISQMNMSSDCVVVVEKDIHDGTARLSLNRLKTAVGGQGTPSLPSMQFCIRYSSH